MASMETRHGNVHSLHAQHGIAQGARRIPGQRPGVTTAKKIVSWLTDLASARVLLDAGGTLQQYLPADPFRVEAQADQDVSSSASGLMDQGQENMLGLLLARWPAWTNCRALAKVSPEVTVLNLSLSWYVARGWRFLPEAGEGLPRRGVSGAPPHPQSAEEKGAEEHDNADEQQKQQALDDDTHEAKHDRDDHEE